jgi:DNA-binding winged helix-turn-helix (wHTH) protein
MTLKYLISDQVIFDSDAHHLISLTSDTVKVTLHTPASQCLLLLLQNQGEVLTQKFLFENIWGKNGAFVSANTLYQNIAIVRKGLKSAGIGDDIVQTIPKTGIKFTGHATLYFAKETDPQEMREASPPVQSLPGEVYSPQNIDVENSATEQNLPASDRQPETLSAPDSALPQKTGHQRISPLYFYLTALVFCGLSLMTYLQLKPEGSFFTDYHLIGKVNGCMLTSSYYDKDVAIKEFSALFQHGGITCTDKTYAYITLNRLPEGTALLMCDKPAEKINAQCLSYLYLEKNDDK